MKASEPPASHHAYRPAPAGAALYVIAVSIGGSLALTALASQDAVAAYEAFVSSPPIVEELVFEDEPNDADGAIAMFGPDASVFYRVRWQPGAFLLLCLRGNGAHQGNTVVRGSGRVGNFFWSYSEEGGISLYTRTDASVLHEASNGVVQTHLAHLRIAAEILNLGVPAEDIGAVRWTRHRFKFTNSLNYLWEGQLVTNREGRVSEILQTARDLRSGQTYHHKTRLGYRDSQSLPSSIRHYTDFGPARGWQLMKSFRIHALETNATPLPPAMFLYDFLNLANTNIIAYSNNMRFLVVKGKTVPINVRPAPTRREVVIKRTALIVLFSVGAAFPWLLWRVTAKRNRNLVS
ncbi:hypothetical protein [Limisphaera sp. VF-2]|jgi:hypothetical protein|uniref:hypothetical protein n=1 Tax=Limisphaera sp. VF-2 TaxID=3400418 RepID=UPI00175C2D49